MPPASPAARRPSKGAECNGGRKLGVGIAGMCERVLQLGGHFEIAAANPGTIIKAVFPCLAQTDEHTYWRWSSESGASAGDCRMK
jgi:signal transduction histidine kinase